MNQGRKRPICSAGLHSITTPGWLAAPMRSEKRVFPSLMSSLYLRTTLEASDDEGRAKEDVCTPESGEVLCPIR